MNKESFKYQVTIVLENHRLMFPVPDQETGEKTIGEWIAGINELPVGKWQVKYFWTVNAYFRLDKILSMWVGPRSKDYLEEAHRLQAEMMEKELSKDKWDDPGIDESDIRD